jgi:hypothetical protein
MNWDMAKIITVEAKGHFTRGSALSVFLDPHRFAGVSGHISILKVLDRKDGLYKDLDSVEDGERKYLVAYTFGDPENKMSLSLGYMSGPNLSASGVSYDGESESFKWSLSAQAQEARVIIEVSAEYRESRNPLRAQRQELLEHVARSHLVPYLSKLPPQLDYAGTSLTPLFSYRGEVGELISKLRDLVMEIGTGVISIKGKGFHFVASMINNQITYMKFTEGSDVTVGAEALSKLFWVKGRAEISAFHVQIEEVMINALFRTQLAK